MISTVSMARIAPRANHLSYLTPRAEHPCRFPIQEESLLLLHFPLRHTWNISLLAVMTQDGTWGIYPVVEGLAKTEDRSARDRACEEIGVEKERTKDLRSFRTSRGGEAQSRQCDPPWMWTRCMISPGIRTKDIVAFRKQIL